METTTRRMKSTPTTNSTEVLTIIGPAHLTRKSLIKTLVVCQTKTRNDIHGSTMPEVSNPRAMFTAIKVWMIDEYELIYCLSAAGDHDAEGE